MDAGIVLTRPLVAADGRVVAARGEFLDLIALRDLATAAPRDLPTLPLHETFVADAVLEALEAEPLFHLVGSAEGRAAAADALATVRFPAGVWKELERLREEDPTRYQHAVWTAVVAARLFRAAMGQAPNLGRLVGGALVHDLGMLHAAVRLRGKRDHLTEAEAMALQDHPLLGAFLLASLLGDAPAVHFALLHHARYGMGYPKLARGVAPLRGLDVLAVSSAFAAMIAPRSFRPVPFDARGAVDQLVEEAVQGHHDERAVRLLIHCLRGGREATLALKLPREPTGARPAVNFHGREVAPAVAPG